jgi:molybdopterin molybdotransferase
MSAGPRTRASLDDAWRWIERWTQLEATEIVRLDQAYGRVLAVSLALAGERPDCSMALIDGYALRAADTVGAGSFNPLVLQLAESQPTLATRSAHLVVAGAALPDGADAVLPLDMGEALATMLEVSEAVAPGAGVARRGDRGRRGDIKLAAGRRLGAAELALAAEIGCRDVEVLRRPRVALALAGAKRGDPEVVRDGLCGLILRDGAEVGGVGDWSAAMAPHDADLILMVGRSGWGPDDDAVDLIAAAGAQLDIHGIACEPGGSAGLGALGETPLVLLPGEPASALIAYEMLAGRLLRRLAGRSADWPELPRSAQLTRKIASPIGLAQWVPIGFRGRLAEPLALPAADRLSALAAADGFLLVPAGCEGYGKDDWVEVVSLVTNGRGVR